MSKRPRALLLVVTGSLGFAAGCLLPALRRRSPKRQADILLFNDGGLPPDDEVLPRDPGARPMSFTPSPGTFAPDAVRRFSLPAPARFEGFRLLDEYRTVLWLEVATEAGAAAGRPDP